MASSRVLSGYWAVLGLVMVTYLLTSLSGRESGDNPAGVLLQVLTAWFALLTAGVRRATRAVAAVFLVATVLTAVIASLVSSGVVMLTANALLYVVAPVAILRHLAIRPVVDIETLVGAVASYVMIGMLFAFCYELTAALQSEPFFADLGDPTHAEALFFSFTTLTTTGYGNLVPAGNPGQALAVTEMLFGQLFLVTVVAKVVGGLARRPAARMAGSADPAETDAT